MQNRENGKNRRSIAAEELKKNNNKKKKDAEMKEKIRLLGG